MTDNSIPSPRDSVAFPYHGSLGTYNLNRFNGTSYGVYKQENSGNLYSGLNYPVDSPGSLLVLPTRDIGCTQEYRPYNSNTLYRRRYYANGLWQWSPWIEEYNSENFPISNEKINPEQIIIPVGVLQLWLLTRPPEGWLICDGSAFNAMEYPLLGCLFPEGKLPALTPAEKAMLPLTYIIRAI